MDEISRRADELLSMPPIMVEREPIDELIANDSDLDGYEHCNLIFTDISEDLNQNVRANHCTKNKTMAIRKIGPFDNVQ